MKTPLPKFFAVVTTLLFLACPAQAEDFAGTYREAATGKVITIKKIDTAKYSVATDDWQGVAFGDKQGKSYKGVFRYNDSAGAKTDKGDKLANAVGYHLFEPTKDGGLKVSLQWGLSPQHGGGNYELQRAK